MTVAWPWLGGTDAPLRSQRNGLGWGGDESQPLRETEVCPDPRTCPRLTWQQPQGTPCENNFTVHRSGGGTVACRSPSPPHVGGTRETSEWGSWRGQPRTERSRGRRAERRLLDPFPSRKRTSTDITAAWAPAGSALPGRHSPALHRAGLREESWEQQGGLAALSTLTVMYLQPVPAAQVQPKCISWTQLDS